ncbi:hypothetical protein CHS0354_033829 [Potamilus streckersoni]|uniref:Uncharacterized protein n=1 Tax=Potamilus streckersoni TaxID=2493646 RepID=A0AAE0W9M6_9BIVA|nr:hypothetical protein CHS0354_033829 [Potamilus streckersoni]
MLSQALSVSLYWPEIFSDLDIQDADKKLNTSDREHEDKDRFFQSRGKKQIYDKKEQYDLMKMSISCLHVATSCRRERHTCQYA